MQSTVKQMATTPAVNRAVEPGLVLRKRIGSTDYRIAVHFSQTSRETMNDKILRLIRNEAANWKEAGR